MTNPAGSFIWYELMTPDPDAAARFYGKVVGWTFGATSPFPGGMDYRMIQRDDGGSAGGILHLTGEMRANGGRPIWLPYFSVADVDSSLADMVADGSTVVMTPIDMEPGRIAMVKDPQGVLFYVMKPSPPAEHPDITSDVYSPDQPQRVSWNELAAPDLDQAKAYYARHFGFEFNEVMDMGPMGDYCFIDHHGLRPGAMMQRHDERQAPAWQIYIRVPSIARAKLAVEVNGGTVMQGPHEVPGGDWIVQAVDPQGATFGLVGAKGD